MPTEDETIGELPPSRPRRRITVSLLSGAIAVVSLIISIWSAFDAHRAVTLQSESAELDRQVALVESCNEASPELFALATTLTRF